MIDSRFAVGRYRLFFGIVFQHDFNGFCQVVCIGRSTCLVEHHFQLRFVSRQVQHGFHEIFTEFRIQPGRADNHVVASGCLDIFFPFQLGQTIHPGRSAFLVFPTRNVVRVTAKHIVRRYMYQETTSFFHRDGQILRCLGIECAAEIYVRFRFVHIGVGCTVYDTIHLVRFYHFLYCFQIGNVE